MKTGWEVVKCFKMLFISPQQSGLPVFVAIEYSPTYTRCLTLKAAQHLQVLRSDLGRKAHHGSSSQRRLSALYGMHTFAFLCKKS